VFGRRRRKRAWLIFRIAYVVLVLVGVYAVYRLVPRGVFAELRRTYLHPEQDALAP
jgi:hypothetical protein